MRAFIIILFATTLARAGFILLHRAGEFPFGKVVWAYPVGDSIFDNKPVEMRLDFKVTNAKIWGETNGVQGMLGYHVVVAGMLGEGYTFGGSPYAYVDGKVHRSAELGFHPQSKGLGDYAFASG